jgi:recombination protein RecT
MSESKELTIVQELEQRLPDYIASWVDPSKARRFLQIAATAIGQNLALVKADRRSLMSAVRRAAEDNLMPDGREGAFVIFRKKVKQNGQEVWIDWVQWMPMIAGYRKRVRRSGEISDWWVGVVRDGDEFDYQLGEEQHVHHKPKLDNEGPLIAAYSICRFIDGTKSYDVMGRKEVMKRRNVSRAKDDGPWQNWEEEMWKKTVARRHFKILPVDEQVVRMAERDDEEDDELPAPAERPKLTVRDITGFAPEEPEPEPEPEKSLTTEEKE